MHIPLRLRLVILLVNALSTTAATAAENAVFDLLLAQGVVLGDGTTIKLAQPTVADGADPADQREMVVQAAGKYDLERFTRPSRVAPFELNIQSAKNQVGERTGQIVDVWFVIHGTLDEIDGQLRAEMKSPQVAEGNDPNEEEGRELTVEELAARGIDPPASSDGVRYGRVIAPLLDRVRISGVIRSEFTRQDRSFLAAFVLDERFRDDEAFPNQWQPISINNLGRQEFGDPRPYSGCGGYVKATELIEPAGAMLVELHVVFNEPVGWFDGANLLRSKLPIIIQERVRKLRGELERLRDE